MSFANGEDVIRTTEAALKSLWKEVLDIDLTKSDDFARIPYETVMSKFGSDKPDRRLNMEVSLHGILAHA